MKLLANFIPNPKIMQRKIREISHGNHNQSPRHSLGSRLRGCLRKSQSRLVAALLVFSISAAFSTPVLAAPSKWETIKTERTDVKTIVKDTEVEIKATRGVIVVSSSRPVQIKVYTILGQLISRETLPAGTSQLNVPAHGVYIIKTGDLTCKVAL